MAVSSSVALKRISTSASTGRFIQSERPRSPLEHVPDPAHVLHRQRLVEAELRAQARDVLLGGLRAQHDLGRIARREVQDEEDDRPTRPAAPAPAGAGAAKEVATHRAVRVRPLLQRDRLHAQVEARVELEALHALGEGRGLDLVVDEDPRRIVDEDALRLPVELGALGLVGLSRAWASSSSKRAFLYSARFGPPASTGSSAAAGTSPCRDPPSPPSRTGRTAPAPCVRSLARNAPHSIVWSVTVTPTALRFDWITRAIATGDCMPEPDSGTQSVVEKPFG